MDLTAKQVVELITPFLTLGGIAFMIYRTFRDPDIKAEKSIQSISEGCEIKHRYLNRDLSRISTDLHNMNINHIDHIEKIHLPAINDRLARIETILDERLPKKQ